MNNTQIAKESFHLGAVPVSKVLGAVLFGMELEWDEQLTSLKQLKGA